MFRLNKTMTVVAVLVALMLSTSSYGQLLTAGLTHTCFWSGHTGHQPYCWGRNSVGQLGLNETPIDPELMRGSEILAMDAGLYHTCALLRMSDGKTKITCWGGEQPELLNVPSYIVNPISLSVGDSHACAIYAPDNQGSKVGCWPGGTINNMPPDNGFISFPTSVYAGNEFTCLIHKVNKLFCWGAASLKDRDIGTELSFPLVSVGAGLSCRRSGVTRKNIDCWTNRPIASDAFIRESRPWATQFENDCILRSGVLTCERPDSGAANGVNKRVQKETPGAFLLAVGQSHACVVESDGLKCFWFAAPTNDASEVLKYDISKVDLAVRFKGIDLAGNFLSGLADVVYLPDAQLLRAIAQQVDDQRRSEQEKRSLLRLAYEFLRFLDYPYVQHMYLEPNLPKIDEVIGGSPIATLDRSILNSLIRSAFDTMRPLLGVSSDRILARKFATETFSPDDGSIISTEKYAEAVRFVRPKQISKRLMGHALFIEFLVMAADPLVSDFLVKEGPPDTGVFAAGQQMDEQSLEATDGKQ